MAKRNSKFIERDTQLRLKYSVPLTFRLEEALATALHNKQKDFSLGSSGFNDHELTERLSQEYQTLRVHAIDRLTADDILRLQEDPELGYDRLVASHPSNSPTKSHG